MDAWVVGWMLDGWMGGCGGGGIWCLKRWVCVCEDGRVGG